MQTKISVEIDRPIEAVFDYAVNHVADWSQTVIEDEVIDQTPDHVGTTFRCVTEERGNRMEFLGTVQRYEPPRLAVCHLAGSMFDLDVEYALEEIEGGTRLTQTSQARGKGFTRIVLFCAGWMMKKSSNAAVDTELGNLKRLLEQHADEAAS